ncbi:hypothetical protein BCR33DRAFT_714266 [Rhizoclosmatium globosum]|uniref:Uncharacterized protein n=1 Tax=Rhizoclosmatium globosum TaxID=329046 RepID=A0A1Y2CNF5_9FUNG|nr:hypothetical protein BCR33DRAFT_714266 [Rhizoclosmatium globosum]|eukprot:ORY48497.1 hypothetical protein BCR33DRAFT_714266 [Rhizoclosmatium globosum]
MHSKLLSLRGSSVITEESAILLILASIRKPTFKGSKFLPPNIKLAEGDRMNVKTRARDQYSEPSSLS